MGSWGRSEQGQAVSSPTHAQGAHTIGKRYVTGIPPPAPICHGHAPAAAARHQSPPQCFVGSCQCGVCRTLPHRILTWTLILALTFPPTGPFLRGLSGVVTQKGPSWVCISPFPFWLLCPPPFGCHAAGLCTQPCHPSPTEEEENTQSICTAEGALPWAAGSGITDRLSLTDGSSDAMLGKIHCTLRGCWLAWAMPGNVLQDHMVRAEASHRMTACMDVNQVRRDQHRNTVWCCW